MIIDEAKENSPQVNLLERFTKEREERRKRVIENLKRERDSEKSSSYHFSRNLQEKKITEKIEDTEEKREKGLRNDALAQDIELKKKTLNRLFTLLTAETVVIFIFALWQGFRTWGFNLEEWSFRLLVGATIIQITTMLLVAVKHLFPNSK